MRTQTMNKYYHTLELHKIIEMLKEQAGNEETKRMIAELEPVSDEEKVKEYCARFDAALADYNRTLGQPFTIEASYGYELVTPTMGELIDKYIDMADQKMYLRKKAKYAGRDA